MKCHFPRYTERQAHIYAKETRSPICDCGNVKPASRPEFWMELTLCGGRGTIAGDDQEVDCLNCIKAWDKGKRPHDELEEFDTYAPHMPWPYRRALRLLRDRHRDEFDELVGRIEKTA